MPPKPLSGGCNLASGRWNVYKKLHERAVAGVAAYVLAYVHHLWCDWIENYTQLLEFEVKKKIYPFFF